MRRTAEALQRWALALIVIPGTPALAQSTPVPKPEFEVATIRQNKAEPDAPRAPGDAQGSVLPGGQLAMRDQPLRTLLGFAFYPGNQRFRGDLIVGAPAWVDTDRFDVIAKAPPDMPARQCFFSGYCYPDTRLAAMLRDFLEKEFKIVDHEERRPTDVYALVAAKGGPKLQKSTGSGERNCKRIVGGSGDPDAKGLSSIEAGSLCVNMTLSNLADMLPEMAGAYIDRIVVNATGLEDRYDFKLYWVGRASIDQGGLTIFEAIEKQLGLKLEARKVPMPVTMIDRIEKLSDQN
jgi:uncharacterized protein (TIGR03435 family)